jgi:hypothetical protein
MPFRWRVSSPAANDNRGWQKMAPKFDLAHHVLIGGSGPTGVVAGERQRRGGGGAPSAAWIPARSEAEPGNMRVGELE